jgi:hypothetical protein
VREFVGHHGAAGHNPEHAAAGGRSAARHAAAGTATGCSTARGRRARAATRGTANGGNTAGCGAA